MLFRSHALQECDFMMNFCKHLELLSMFLPKKIWNFLKFFFRFYCSPSSNELGSRKALSRAPLLLPTYDDSPGAAERTNPPSMHKCLPESTIGEYISKYSRVVYEEQQGGSVTYTQVGPVGTHNHLGTNINLRRPVLQHRVP